MPGRPGRESSAADVAGRSTGIDIPMGGFDINVAGMAMRLGQAPYFFARDSCLIRPFFRQSRSIASLYAI